MLGYACANILFFLLNPGSSPWHYHSHNPKPLPIVSQDDSNLSLVQISEILDEIDLAYKAREPSTDEQTRHAVLRGVSLVLFPATFALIMREFVGYMGPATTKQQEFTLSVKKRYNHLARLALSKGMKRDGNFFVEEPSLSKRNGAPFQSANGLLTKTPAPSDGRFEPQVPDGYFKLKSMFQEPNNRCLESNRVAPSSMLGGASFMDICQDVSGQLWKAMPASNGYFRLTSMFLETENMCLEGSKPFAPDDLLNGAARMDPCGNFKGQLWRLIPRDNGYFQITNMFLEGENRCLESSTPTASGDPLKGAARMSPCGNFSGQMWKLQPFE